MPSKLFGLIGDVHAEDALLAAALDYFTRERVDRILCVGDIVDGRGSVDRCVELLEQHHVANVRGNHDRWMLDDPSHALFALAKRSREYLAALPRTLDLDTAAGKLCLCHAIGTDDMTFVHDDDEGRTAFSAWKQRGNFALVVAGHLHQRGVWRFGHRVTWINCGTLKSDDCPCFAILDLGKRFMQWFDLDDGGRVIESEREKLP